MPYSALPEPMLARSAKLPTGHGWSFEVKWDGFRAILSTEGPQRVRRRRLDDPRCPAPEAFEDGDALWRAVREHELEGVVAKRDSERYRAGERRWVEVKNRDYGR